MALQSTRWNSVDMLAGGSHKKTGRKVRTVKRPEIPPRLTLRRPLKHPALPSQTLCIHSPKHRDNRVERSRNDEDVQRQEELGCDLGLAPKQNNGKHQRNDPKWDSISLRKLLHGFKIVVQTAIHPRCDLKASGNQEPTDTTDAADQDMTGDKTDDIPKLELAHEVEYSSGKHRTEGVRGDCSCNDGIRLVLAYQSGDGGSHVVKKGHNFDLVDVSIVAWE